LAEYSTEEEAKQAISKLNGTKLDGREILVRAYDERPEKSEKPERKRSRDVEYRKDKTSGRQLYVGNLPFSVEWRHLKDIFNKYAKVERADVITKKNVRR
jgi:RNA recognition motif-containing protein